MLKEEFLSRDNSLNNVKLILQQDSMVDEVALEIG